MRGLFMFMVYYYHAEVFYGNQHSISWFFQPFFLTGFFFISGYLFTSDWNKITIKSKLKQATRSILIPYMSFTVVTQIPRVLLMHYDWKIVASDIILLRASWFITALVVVQLLYTCVLKLSKKVGMFLVFTCIFSFIGYCFILLFRENPDWLSHFTSPMQPGLLPFCINHAFVATPFFAAGMLYRKYQSVYRIPSKLKLGIPMLAMYFILIIADKYLGIGTSIGFASCSMHNPLLLLFYFAVSMTSFIAIGQVVNKIPALNYIGKFSLWYYMINIIMIRIAGKLYDVILVKLHLVTVVDHNAVINVLLVTIIAVVLSIPTAMIIVKYVPWMVGDKAACQKLTDKLNIKINW